jgi:deoxyadenosine/deoxycytidine kinase
MDEIIAKIRENFFYIALEGVIGAGKTTLAYLLAEKLSAQLILERFEENPFLPKFYENPEAYAFQTQVFFLLDRFKQQQELTQRSLFYNNIVSDYCFCKDRIFASVNLNDAEFKMYDVIEEQLSKKILKPNLIILLQASIDTLLYHIQKRGRSYEMNITNSYLAELSKAYNDFFFRYDQCPVLVINMDNLDFESNPELIDDLLVEISKVKSGMNFFNKEM